MTTQIALLRAVNVGGHAKVTMEELRQVLDRLGMQNPRTLLQTGNLVFESPSAAGPELEQLLESETERRLGLRTDILVRALNEMAALVAGNPFAQEAEEDPSHLLVVFLKTRPPEGAAQALDALPGPERVRQWDRHLFATYPAGIGRSPLTMSYLERKLGTRGTARNWNTVLKLDRLAQESIRS